LVREPTHPGRQDADPHGRAARADEGDELFARVAVLHRLPVGQEHGRVADARHKDEMELAVVVAHALVLVVVHMPAVARRVGCRLRVQLVVEDRARQGAGLDRRADGRDAQCRLRRGRRRDRLRERDRRRLERDRAAGRAVAHQGRVRRSARRRVGNGRKCEEGARHDRGGLDALAAPARDGIARRVVVLHERRREEIRHVRRDHAALCEAAAWIRLLHGPAHGGAGQSDVERDVDPDHAPVAGARAAAQKHPEQHRPDDGHGMRAERGAEQEVLVQLRAALPPVEALLCPRVRKVHEEHETLQDEHQREARRHVVRPHEEEAAGEEEGERDEKEPRKDLGAPPAVLDRGLRRARVVHVDEERGQEQVQQGKRKGDAVHSQNADARLLLNARKLHVAERPVLERAREAGREAQPRHQRVHAEQQGIAHARRDRRAEVARLAYHRRRCRRT